MQKLDEKVVIRIIREEWEKRKVQLREKLNTVYKSDDKESKHAISPGLKVKNKESGILCTIDVVGPEGVIMRAPEGTKFSVSSEDLEKNYELG